MLAISLGLSEATPQVLPATDANLTEPEAEMIVVSRRSTPYCSPYKS